MKALLASTLALAVSAPALAATPEATARAALARSPIVDGHNDVAEAIRERFDGDFTKFDLRDTTNTATADKIAMQTDLARLRKGRVGGQFWSVWVPTGKPEAESVQEVLEAIDTIERLVARYPNDLVMAHSAADIETAFKRKKIASLIGMEGGHSIGSSLAVLREMYRAGARYMTITHSKNTPWADSATDAPKSNGLAPFGKEVVREMNRLGMLVDLSHVSEKTMHDALDITTAPVIFSHSSARAIDGHLRNVPDSVLSRLPRNGGVVMVTFVEDFTEETARQWSAAKAAEETRQATLWSGDPEAAKQAVASWVQSHPRPRSTLAKIADHIDHIRKVAGIDHVGVGGDYDGMPSAPVGLDDVAGYPALFTELARRGYSQADLEKISSRNIIRVLRAAEGVAAKLKDRPPGETRFKPD